MFFQETKCDDIDSDNVCTLLGKHGYTLHAKNRTHSIAAKRKSGGLAVVVKSVYEKYVHPIATSCKYVQWVKFDKGFFHKGKPVLIGNVYIPPEGSPYSDITALDEIQLELLEHCRHDDFIVGLIGDFNAYTNVCQDHCELEMDNDLEVEGETFADIDLANELYKLTENGANITRSSEDKKRPNNYGNRLLEFCKTLTYFILNGRVGDDKSLGKATTSFGSVVDYIIGQADLVSIITNLRVIPFNPLYSDVHSPLCVTLSNLSKCVYVDDHSVERRASTERAENSPDPRCKIRWEQTLQSEFVKNINRTDLQSIEAKLETNPDPNEISKLLTTTILNSANKTFPPRPKHRANNSKPKETQKAWYNEECKLARQQYIEARKKHIRIKSQEMSNVVRLKSKEYKKVMNRAIVTYKRNFSRKIKNLKCNDPKAYWSLLSNKKANDVSTNISIEVFRDHFEKLNTSLPDDNPQQTADNLNNDILDQPITEAEITKALKKQKSGKSAGCDGIINEYLKASANLMMPILVRLFNAVLDSATVPEAWLEGLIVPIYKNKGDRSDANNYTGITLLSCIGKTFTSVLNNRLEDYINEFNILSENQSGFRRHYSTNDHAFLLKCLVDMFLSTGRKLYVGFVDYAKAFDSVWRIGLWRKLLANGVNGKDLNVIQGLYTGSKSKVLLNGFVSNGFGCHVGVRQGENLSPLLFSLYLNDLEEFLSSYGCNHVILQTAIT